MDRHRNAVLKSLMAWYDYTHRSLAKEINKVRDVRARQPGKCTDRHVRRWISGEVRWPWGKCCLALERIFERPAQAQVFVPRGKSSTRLPAPPQPRTPVVREQPVQRRRFIA
ncbi:hypothetical protein [Streptomyces sp. NPDC055099]